MSSVLSVPARVACLAWFAFVFVFVSVMPVWAQSTAAPRPAAAQPAASLTGRLVNSLSGDPVTGTAGKGGFGTVLQGFLETSNVNTVQEVTNLITAQRAYEMNSKVIQTVDQLLQNTNTVIR